MTDLTLIQQTEQSLAAIKSFASQSNNGQMLEHIQRLEAALSALTVVSDTISVGDISGSTAVAIGHDINIIINQVLPPAVKQPLENIQKQWTASHLELRKALDHSQGRHVFLSYTRADMDIALQIRRELEKAGHIVWQDLTAIKGGDEWIKSIEQGVEKSYALVTVVSEASQKSEWVQIEYLHAKRRGKTIIPIKVDTSEIPTIMLALNVVHGHPDLGAGIAQLLESLPALSEITPEAPDRRALELRYLDGLLLEHSVWQEVYTPMAGVGQLRAPKEHKPTGISMRTTPTTIDVGYLGRKFTQGEEDDSHGEAEPKNYEADITLALEQMRQLVILGEPGAGKTTTLWKILSDHALQAKTDPNAPLPVLVRLGALGSMGLEASLKAAFDPLGSYYNDILKEKRLVFLLDGLNEMPTAHRDENLKSIKVLSKQCRMENLLLAVTCRELDYTNTLDLKLPGRVTIQPLTPLRIYRFVCNYIQEIGKGDELFWQLAGTEMQKIWSKAKDSGINFEQFWLDEQLPNKLYYSDKKIEYSHRMREEWNYYLERQNRSMMKLASNPYMLYMLIKIFSELGVLPPNRALLIQSFVDYLLEKREKLDAQKSNELKTNLAKLAYEMQKNEEGTSFAKEQLQEHLISEKNIYDARNASIIIGEQNIRFAHQLLQEYFAAYYLLENKIETTRAQNLFQNRYWMESPKSWEEVFILLAGLYSSDCTPVINWLVDSDWHETASRCIAESGAYYPDNRLLQLRDEWLSIIRAVEGPDDVRRRAAFGRALGRLKIKDKPLDNRKGVSVITIDGESLPDIDWVEIPSGNFPYQDKEDDCELRFEPSFFISRFPITFSQFQLFLDDMFGVNNPNWWQGLLINDSYKFETKPQEFPFYNHPRENVSFYDAVAYCRWLTEKSKNYPALLPDGIRNKPDIIITLPTEWQWEKAARGTEKDFFPTFYKEWEQEAFDFSFNPFIRINIQEAEIGQTSAVGVLRNKSPFNVFDMYGNVFEWCLNHYYDPSNIKTDEIPTPDWRVSRGGAWNSPSSYANLTHREGFSSKKRHQELGFRIVLYSHP